MATQLSDLLLNDRGFAFDPTSGETFQLSTTGLAIVRHLQHGADEATVLTRLAEEFEVDENTARRDLGDFLQSLALLGWQV